MKTFLQFWPWLFSERMAPGAAYLVMLWVMTSFLLYFTYSREMPVMFWIPTLLAVVASAVLTAFVWKFYKEDVAYYGGVRRSYRND